MADRVLVANCTLLFNNGDFNSAVTHEVGHTLGFRHSDQTRADNPSVACTSDPSLECSSSAIMKAFITTGLNGALQTWDVHAVQSVYPGTTSGTLPGAPTGFGAHAISSTAVTMAWNPGTGATSYRVYRRGAGGAYTLIATTTATSYTDTTAAPNSAYLYYAESVNAAGFTAGTPDLATTVIFTDDPLSAGIVVKAVHLAELRDALDPALPAVGRPAGGWTDTTLAGVVIKAVHFQEIRDRVK